jgi:hypothetical protein
VDDSDSGPRETTKEKRHEGLAHNVTATDDHNVFAESGDVVCSYQLDDPERGARHDERMG